MYLVTVYMFWASEAAHNEKKRVTHDSTVSKISFSDALNVPVMLAADVLTTTERACTDYYPKIIS